MKDTLTRYPALAIMINDLNANPHLDIYKSVILKYSRMIVNNPEYNDDDDCEIFISILDQLVALLNEFPLKEPN